MLFELAVRMAVLPMQCELGFDPKPTSKSEIHAHAKPHLGLSLSLRVVPWLHREEGGTNTKTLGFG